MPTFREKLDEFLAADPTRGEEVKTEAGDIEKLGLDPKLTVSVDVCTMGPCMVSFDFDAEGNLLDIRSGIVLDDVALRDIAENPALDDVHRNILLCSADHIEEAEEGLDAKDECKKEFLN